MKKTLLFLESLLISMALIMNLNNQSFKSIPYITRNTMITIMLVWGVYLILEKCKKISIEKNKKIILIIFSFIIAVMQIVSYNFTVYNSISNIFRSKFQILKAIVFITGNTMLIYNLIIMLLSCLKKIKFSKARSEITTKLFDRHPIRNSFLIILPVYLIWFFLFFPGNTTADYYDEIYQYNTIQSYTSSSIILKNENQFINGHHSAFHTFVVGKINNVGIDLKNENIGLALNAFIQIVFFAIVLSYTFKLYKELKINYKFRTIILLLYLFLPVFFVNAFTVYKDAPFTMAMVLFSCILVETCYLDKRDWKTIVKLIISSLLMMMLSKKGMYILVFSSIALIIMYFKNFKKLALLMLILLVLGVSYDKILYNVFDVTPGSIREILAVPIQQIGRTVSNHGDELSKKDKESLNKVLEVDKLKDAYNPILADTIKSYYFNKNYTDAEMKSFLQTYIKLFFKYPGTYISAFLNLTSGYTYIPAPRGMVYWNLTNDSFYVDGLTTYSKSNRVKKTSAFVEDSYRIIMNSPGISMLFSMGLYFWLGILMIALSITKTKLKEAIPFIPLFVSILFLFVSPVNSNPRYVMPIASLVIVLAPYFVLKYNERGNKYEEIKKRK